MNVLMTTRVGTPKWVSSVYTDERNSVSGIDRAKNKVQEARARSKKLPARRETTSCSRPRARLARNYPFATPGFRHGRRSSDDDDSLLSSDKTLRVGMIGAAGGSYQS